MPRARKGGRIAAGRRSAQEAVWSSSRAPTPYPNRSPEGPLGDSLGQGETDTPQPGFQNIRSLAERRTAASGREANGRFRPIADPSHLRVLGLVSGNDVRSPGI